MEEQTNLLELPERPPAQGQDGVSAGKVIPKLRTVDRTEMMMANISVEELIPADHKARAIWNLTGRLDLSGFIEPLRTAQGCAGRSAWDPRVLVSMWVYAYSEKIGSAREIERTMQWEPGMQWLAGLEVVNHHTLSDFRVDHKKALDELFAQLLALLASEGLVNLERVMHDGTKIRAQAGAGSFRREKTLREHLEERARQWSRWATRQGRRRPRTASGRRANEWRLEAANRN